MLRSRRKVLVSVAVAGVMLVVGGVVVARTARDPFQHDVDARAVVLTSTEPRAACAAASSIQDLMIRTSAVFGWIGSQRGAIAPDATRCLCALVHPSEVASCDRRASAAHLRR